MSDLTEQLWPAFEAEVGEQLEQLEQGLARGHDADVHALFRLFHTIKSSAAMMAFGSMEAIAHAAEDFLDVVRSGRSLMSAPATAALLQAVDTLRRQLGEGLATRQAPQAAPDVERALKALLGDGAPSPADVPIAEAEAGTAGTDAPDDDHMAERAGLFCEMAAMVLPEMAAALVVAETALPDMAALSAAADNAGLLVVVRLLSRLEEASPDARLRLFEELLARVQHVEALGGESAGTAVARERLRPALAPALVAALQTAAVVALQPPSAATAGQWLDVVQPVRHLCRLLGLGACERLLALATQILRDLGRGAFELNPMLVEQLPLALTVLAELPLADGEDATATAMAEQLLDNLQQALLAGEMTAPVPALPLSPEMQAVLSASCRAQLDAHVAAGHTLAEIDADLEAMPDGGEAFVAWLAAHGTPLANHTLFRGAGRDESTQLRFLAAFTQSAETLAADFSALDPDGSLLQLRLLRQGRAPVAGAAASDTSPPAGASVEAAARVSQSTVRIDSSTLDRFVNRVGELVMLRNMMSHSVADPRLGDGLRRLRQFVGTRAGDAAERDALLELVGLIGERREQWQQADAQLQTALSQLQDEVLALRVVPVGSVFNRMTRVVWSLAQAQDKTVQVDIQGEDTRIDKGMVDILAEPLSHMVRNAVDHGIEGMDERLLAGKPATAVLTLAARQQGNALVITVADDGRGLDLARILAKARRQGLAGERDYSDDEITAFIFAPGFSTAETVTAVSGRGVGMDVVKTRIAQIGGQVDVVSQRGAGTRFTLRLPLSVALQNVVLVEAEGRVLALPERQVSEVFSLSVEALQSVQGQAACLLRGVVLPLYGLTHLLGRRETAMTAREQVHVVVFSDGRHRIGLVVDAVQGRQEVFVRDIHPDILRLPGVGGASILGDGSVIIIADGDKLMELARQRAQGLAELLKS
ncbi:MAG: chemotaxis protein CheA [Moraxellaceae bacterium]|nr:chemotaxis protein CheA [Moraxellaceae bacterium]